MDNYNIILGIDLDTEYNEVRECDYKDEHYIVRDNGSVLRKQKSVRKRKYDEIWTFGSKNPQNGYMHIGTHRIHIIVATAFYGAKDSKIYVVDHIDTNRCNNRPENLRWLTRLENALLNPDTLRKITFLCGGDIMKFINDPSCLSDLANEPDISWMRTVSSKEAKAAYKRVLSMNTKQSGHKESILKKRNNQADKLERDTYNNWRFTAPKIPIYERPQPIFTKGLVPNSTLQKDWKTPTEFLCCPSDSHGDPMRDYFNNLEIGITFSRNQYGSSIVLDYALIDVGKTLLVATASEDVDSVKPYGLTMIHHSGSQFIHESKGTFFEENGAMKQFALAQGKEWTGGDGIDDFC
jgi:hypothetical protein